MKTIRIAFCIFLSVVLFNSCQKEYSIESGGVIAPSGSWEFKDGSKQFQGNMDTAYIDSTGTTKELHLIGTSIDGLQTFHLHLYADNFQAGNYRLHGFYA